MASAPAATVADTRRAISAALAGTAYSCKTISWDDVSRGTVGGSLSCWGSNITDTRLKAKDGTDLFTVRSDNWDEKLGEVRAGDVALLVGNCEHGEQLRNVTLTDFLKSPAESGGAYAGLDGDLSLADADADAKVSIRFQTVFLPIQENASMRGAQQFAAEAYNYSTRSDDDPRNLVLLATTQGLSVQSDGVGSKRLYLHAGAPGTVKEYWLEAESSAHKVGGPQQEAAAEWADALARGKATSETIGIKALGTRFNVLITVQVPLEQREQHPEAEFVAYGCYGGGGGDLLSFDMAPSPKGAPVMACWPSGGMSKTGSKRKSGRTRDTKGKSIGGCGPGRASAARVSRGDVAGVHKPLEGPAPKRNANEHVTVTCVLYNTVAGGLPSAEDVLAAAADMDALYAACSETGRLADAGFYFMKKPLAVDDLVNIHHKLTTQPPPAPKQ